MLEADAGTRRRDEVASPALSYDRTWDRRKVHRTAVSEVFVTDAVVCDQQTVRVAAQTPPCHAYFGDHVPTPDAADPLLLMEICRQSGLVTAYELGVPTDVVLATEDWDLTIVEPAAVGWGSATDLVVESRFDWTRVRQGRPREGLCHQRVSTADGLVAELRATSRFLTQVQLTRIRRSQRGSEPPRTDQLAERTVRDLVAPHLVGRRNPLNVVLSGLVFTDATASARVTPALANRSLFDHSYDHVTMQILGEAARQLLTAVDTVRGRLFSTAVLTRQRGHFRRFAELDSPVYVTADLPRAATDTWELAVRVSQEGADIAVFWLTAVVKDSP
jgi:hypothetical protein